MKSEKAAILLVSFGTSYSEARKNALEPLGKELCEAAGTEQQFFFYEAYTSKQILGRLRQEQETRLAKQALVSQAPALQPPVLRIYEVEEALEEAYQNEIKYLYIVPTHLLPGIEYQKLKETAAVYQTCFSGLYLAPAILQQEQDCVPVAEALRASLAFQEEKEYILMGHGTEDLSHIRYEQLNATLWRSGMEQVQIALVEGEPGLETAICRMQKREKTKKEVVLQPFMVLAGRHARLDMAGEGNSFASRLRKEGYSVTPVLRGLADYPAFRSLYLARFRQMLKK